MRRLQQLCALSLAALFGLGPVPHTHAAGSTWGGLIAFLRDDNVWVARADGSGAHQLTGDGTGTRTVGNKQVTYSYLTWSPDGQRLLVARFQSTNPPDGPYRQGWSLETWAPGSARLAPLVRNINSQDFAPHWSSDGRTITYIGASRYVDKTTLYENTVTTVDLAGRVTTLTRFRAHEGCLDGTTDPSELTFWTFVGPGGVRQTFAWSSTGHFLIYASECIHTGLMYRNLATGAERAVGRWMTEAALSPSNRALIGVVGSRLVLSNSDGTGRHVFSSTAGARLPVWSPNGRFVYYLSRRTMRTLRSRDHAGNLFEIQVNRASIMRLDVSSGKVTTVLTLPVHAFANLAMSPDGKWLYFTKVPNSDVLYQHLIHSPKVTNELLTRYGPRAAVMRMATAGGQLQTLARDSAGVALPGVGGS